MRPTPVWLVTTLRTLNEQRVLLNEIGLERFKKLAFELRFRSQHLPLKQLPLQGRLSEALRQIKTVPPEQQEAAKALLLARRSLGRFLVPAEHTSRRQFRLILEWLTLERFLIYAATASFDWNLLPEARDLRRNVLPAARFDVIRESDLSLEQKYLAVATWLKGTEFGDFALQTRSFPPDAPDYKQALLEYVGQERFLELVQQAPLFDLNSIKGCTTKFRHMLSRIQMAELSPADEERALVSLLCTTELGKRLILGAGLPLPDLLTYEHNRLISSYKPLQTMYRDERSVPAHIRAVLDGLGRQRFLELVREPLFDLQRLRGYASVKQTKPRLRLVQESPLPAPDKERALVAVLCRSAWAELLAHDDQGALRAIRRHQSGKVSQTKSVHGFQRRLNYLGPRRFLELAQQPLFDLARAFPKVVSSEWPSYWAAAYHSALDGEELERAYASALARSVHGKRYLAEARRIAEEEGVRELRPLPDPPTTALWRPQVPRDQGRGRVEVKSEASAA